MKELIRFDASEDIKKAIVEEAGFKMGAFLRKSPKKESSNEDAFAVFEHKGALWMALSDGAGGHPKGRDASLAYIEAVEKALKDKSDVDLLVAHKLGHQAVIELRSGSRSAATVVKMHEGMLEFVSTGDVEVLLWNRLGKLLVSNTPHSIAGFLVEADVLDQDEALQKNNRHIVSHMVGDDYLKADYTCFENLSSGNLLLLGSDGVFDNLSHQELTDLLFPGSFENVFEKLTGFLEQDVSQLRKPDDISFLLVKGNS